MSRRFGYGICNVESGIYWNSRFGFGSHGAQVTSLRKRIPQLFDTETLFIPPIFDTGDDMVTNPVFWLKKTMARYVASDE